uniref:Putative secreted peptide n=1 Tax=Anopheles braziliensis TaxID=58242 RepID=A0A2M3ZR14_9DIPT
MLLLVSGLCKAVRLLLLLLLLLLLFESDFMLRVCARYHHSMLQWTMMVRSCIAGSDFTVRWSIQLR